MRKYSSLVAARVLPIFLAVFSLFGKIGDAETAAIESGVHLPNLVGRNICFGIQVPPNLNAPALRSIRRLGSEEATHEIIFDGVGQLAIKEVIVDSDRCRNVSTNAAVWSRDGSSDFCLASWDKGLFVRVSLRVTAKNQPDKNALMTSLYSISACKLGEQPNAPSFGDVLKMDRGFPVLRSH